ncbi:flagellar hook-associated protein FlgK [Marinomonas mediterranea]|uniref:flagellar hook-associated protein FlgK n=1 Tax=Marinomonas mediterranea TaxID=119864 RepID=UPI00234A4BAD|nr:flagellar hook-associated protein FlgK [Marinomonas mediterranea]WCN10519.1 flagellar hook-associated protein FlgK [Marinomonas mediterranea]
MGTSLLNIGLSGLQTSSARISTVGQNVSNVDTEGYNRQETATSSVLGGGVKINDTSRLVDQFRNQQVWSDNSKLNYYKTYSSMMDNMDNVVGEDSVSLNTYLSKSFTDLQTANSDPSSSSARNTAYSSFESLVQRYNEMASIVDEQKTTADKQINAVVESVNEITSQISNLNTEILKQETQTGTSANELRDQQEQLVTELSSYLDIDVAYDDNELMTVKLAGSTPLVLQGSANEISLERESSGSDNLTLKVDFGSHDVGASTDDIGGSLGALIDYRDEFSDEAERTLGLQALVLADSLNTQNKLGLDADGNYGNNLLSTGEITVTPNDDNGFSSGDIKVRVTEGASSELTTNSYEVEMISSTQFVVNTYNANGKVVEQSDPVDTSTATPNSDGYYEVDGFGIEVQFDSGGTYSAEDTFSFVPTESAAKNLELSASNGDDFALASPISVSKSSSNLSDVEISVSTITNLDPATSGFSVGGGLDSTAPQSIVFTPDNTTYEVRDGAGNTLATVAGVTDYTNLLEQAGLAAAAGYDISVSSAPKAGDEYNIEFNTDSENDNYNGLLLAEIQNASLVNGSETLTEAYSSFVTSVGSLTSTLSSNETAAETVYNQSVNSKDQISGVSLDEEAVNLLKYQQSYSASAQVISAARTTFDTLLGVVG